MTNIPPGLNPKGTPMSEPPGENSLQCSSGGVQKEPASTGCCTGNTGPAPEIRTATSIITPASRWDHFAARWGINRMGHTVAPGLYRLGHPKADSPVFASANYTLSFDALRSALAGY